jgi:hypothetical protein
MILISIRKIFKFHQSTSNPEQTPFIDHYGILGILDVLLKFPNVKIAFTEIIIYSHEKTTLLYQMINGQLPSLNEIFEVNLL